ncbi:MAG: hypothetical protein K2Z81_28545 [Cyanobacteria bacterium]|nr:hypothetical protein [Cyanobacteriota bacterium]
MAEKKGKKAATKSGSGAKSKTAKEPAKKIKKPEPTTKKTKEVKSSPRPKPVDATVKPGEFVDEEFPNLLSRIDENYHQYVGSVLKHPIRQFQKSTVDDFLRSIETEGFPEAIAQAVDSRDYVKGNAWEKSRLDIMDQILPTGRLLAAILSEAVAQDSTLAVKWFAEASGSPKEISKTLVPVLQSEKDKNRWWAAIHLSRSAPETDGLLDVLLEALRSDWIAAKLDHSSSGMTGKGEAARAIARLNKRAKGADEALERELTREEIDAADAAEISGALYHLTGDLENTLDHLTAIAERILIEKRGTSLHGGDRDLLKTLDRLISKWKSSDKKDNSKLDKRVELLESEIRYHLY